MAQRATLAAESLLLVATSCRYFLSLLLVATSCRGAWGYPMRACRLCVDVCCSVRPPQWAALVLPEALPWVRPRARSRSVRPEGPPWRGHRLVGPDASTGARGWGAEAAQEPRPPAQPPDATASLREPSPVLLGSARLRARRVRTAHRRRRRRSRLKRSCAQARTRPRPCRASSLRWTSEDQANCRCSSVATRDSSGARPPHR
jgi:hypothetical protein